jgi:hypothetical protein
MMVRAGKSKAGLVKQNDLIKSMISKKEEAPAENIKDLS